MKGKPTMAELYGVISVKDLVKELNLIFRKINALSYDEAWQLYKKIKEKAAYNEAHAFDKFSAGVK